MLSLLRVEMRKLFRGKIFLITMLVYVLSVFGTFIPLSYTGAFVEETPTMPVTGIAEVDESLAEAGKELVQLNDTLQQMRGGDNFVRQFYSSVNGLFVVVVIFAIAFIISDFMSGTLRATLLCGYTRSQVYVAKLAACITGGAVFLVLNLVLLTFVGTAFYGMELSGRFLYQSLCVVLGQCVVMVGFAAVSAAFSFLLGNGWAYLYTMLFFCLTGVPIIVAVARGQAYSYAATFLPSLISVSGIEKFVTLEQMLSMPEAWSARFVLPALATVAALTALSTVFGIKALGRKQL